MTDRVTTLLGWTFAQWAEAYAHYKNATDETLSADMDGAIKLAKWWRGRRADQPGEMRLIEVSAECDWGWAAPMLEDALERMYKSF